jgi:hypothetical protein
VVELACVREMANLVIEIRATNSIAHFWAIVQRNV